MFDGRMQPAKWIEQMIAHADNSAPDLQRAIAELQCKLDERTSELDEALAQQVATADVLQVINSSRGDLAPVFDAILEKAHNLCGVAYGSLQIYDGERFRAVAVHNLPERFANLLRQGFRGSDHPVGRALLDGDRLAHISDCAEIDYPTMRAAVELAGIRTALFVPLRRDDALLGQIVAARREVRPFTEKEIALLESFAAQAVIAIENARLFGELRQRTDDLSESLQHQTATADVLKVISRSTFDLQTVFETLAESAVRLCSAERGLVFRFDGPLLRFTVGHNVSPEFRDFLEGNPIVPGRNSNAGRAALERRTVHNLDVQNDPEYNYGGSRVDPYRTVLAVPMLKGGELFGVFVIYRHEVRPFTDSQIALMETFADQAVIAIENTRLISETREALEQQTATGDVLKIISRSSVDLETVLDTLVETVARLCRADQAVMFRRRDDVYHLVASRGLSEEAKEFVLTNPVAADRGTLSGRVTLERRAVHVADVLQDPEYTYTEGQKVQGYRTMLGIPLLREDSLIGVFSISRTSVEPFTTKEIELATTFADQAVIAIENARLFEELRESLEQQTATAEVLQVINTSPGDLKPVFDAVLGKALELCDAAYGILWSYQDGKMYATALRGVPPAYADFLTRQGAHPVGPDNAHGRLLRGEPVVHIADAAEDKAYLSGDAIRRATVELGGSRTLLSVPLRKDNDLLGLFVIYRQEVRPFSDKQIALLQHFAAQAVIAMENARLLTETREALERQTATAEVLQVINTSPGELTPVFDAILDKALRLSHSAFGVMRLFDGTHFQLAAEKNVPPAYLDFTAERIVNLTGVQALGAAVERVITEKRVIQIVDAKDTVDELYQKSDPMRRAIVDLAGARSILFVPLLNDDVARGTIMVFRTEVKAFSDKEIALLQNFAAQAVIAMDNARLLGELRERQAELRVTFDNMGDGVAMFDSEPRLVAWNRNFQEILDLPDALLAEHLTYVEYLRMLAERGEFGTLDNIEEELDRRLRDLDRPALFARTRPDGKVIEARRNPVPGGGFVLIYSDITERKRAEAEISAARDAAETALRDLQAAQASLIHAQKMAALGQLTAGIAHEIKNPLNFVNNFAGLSVELLEELKEASAEAIVALDAGKRSEILETIGMLTGNLEKIAEHGRRADGIVRGMLQHSRGSSGDWQATDLNALVEESLNLAYHGARAQYQDFKVTLELDLDRNLTPIEVVSQDVSRVLLNIISNGFYAVTRRGREGDAAFRPLLTVATREFGEAVEIRVRDNGVGIPPEYREKLFQPFFTTKPTGEGTGLGLSISYEIIIQQHGGTITVDSEVGDFSEFTVRLPRRRHGMA
jgi:two-component system, NtrC family, sensor kinase